jgi:putative phosphonate metabolism protein
LSSRHAIYFAPGRESLWWAFGTRWLGRDEYLDRPLVAPAVDGLDAAAMAALTEQPRRYGFHATLKAPFRLLGGLTGADLLYCLEAFARTRRAIVLGPLTPVLMDGFVALVPQAPPSALEFLASACVTEFDGLRAPLTTQERHRRSVDPADIRASELFERYGYPHVLERFRFHMTLTGPVNEALAQRLVAQLVWPVAQLNAQEPPVLDRLCLFVEPTPDVAFRRITDVRLAP